MRGVQYQCVFQIHVTLIIMSIVGIKYQCNQQVQSGIADKNGVLYYDTVILPSSLFNDDNVYVSYLKIMHCI